MTDALSKLFHWVWAIFICIVLAGLGLIFVPQYRTYNANKAQLESLRERRADAEARLAELRRKQERFQNDPAYVEHVAHEVGMVKPNETIFRFYDDNAAYAR